MPQNERMRVWKGELKKTSGGLTKDMLMKNKRGKIVSKKKSEAAKKSDENNLGSWLRAKGDKFEGEPKGLKTEDKKIKQEKVVNAPKKKVVNAPKKKLILRIGKKKNVVNQKPKVVNAKPKRPTAEPMKAGEKKEYSKISVGNILVKGQKQEVKQKQLTDFEIRQKYIRRARKWRRKFSKSKDWIINKLGPLPPGVTWKSIQA